MAFTRCLLTGHEAPWHDGKKDIFPYKGNNPSFIYHIWAQATPQRTTYQSSALNFIRLASTFVAETGGVVTRETKFLLNDGKGKCIAKCICISGFKCDKHPIYIQLPALPTETD